ncbi:Protein LURP-one-related 8 [Striga hermonthica]|uniref:Protein LURP-one-related 8 n=1 Tax=Striga hermonthica TaxID=68872 RepID=A0A9N7N7V1_STRHE|nr:Protein LURP-one-related 8 [Striga hermonthica]
MKWELMKKIYPNGNGFSWSPSPPSSSSCSDDDPMVVLTVWKKSLVLNCEGFTVFDANGNLIYRVDNYIIDSPHRVRVSNSNEIFLMDALGNSILTIRRQRKMKFPVGELVGEVTGDQRLARTCYQMVLKAGNKRKGKDESTVMEEGSIMGKDARTEIISLDEAIGWMC